MNGGSSINIHTQSPVGWIAGEKFLCNIESPVWCSLMTWRDKVGEGREAREGREVCIIMAHLHCCTVETNTAL